jgi:hypothetical protein
VRMGGILVVSDAVGLSLNLEYQKQWHCDLERFEYQYKADSRYLTNYTLGHEGDPNHAWHPVGYEVYPKSDSSEYDAVCIVSYAPSNPQILEEYAKSISK